MTSLKTTHDDCQTNDTINLFPIDSSMRLVFTGYFNGFGVEIRSQDEMALLHHMGCYGKGSFSRGKPKFITSDTSQLMRKRQFQKRSYWYKKFGGSAHSSSEKLFFKELDELTAKLKNIEKQCGKDVIDLVSSDDENMSNEEFEDTLSYNFERHGNEDVVVIVPNSDSEDDNYFANMKPKCCINKTKLLEKLMLTLPEAYFLMYGIGCLQIIHENKLLNIQQCWELFTKTDQHFLPRYIVYHYYRSKGYVVKPGIKFGGDYVIYREGPGIRHADYIVVVKFGEETLDWISVLGHVRMSVTTVKDILIAEVIIKGDYKVPEMLNHFEVREVLLNRKTPVTVNEY